MIYLDLFYMYVYMCMSRWCNVFMEAIFQRCSKEQCDTF